MYMYIKNNTLKVCWESQLYISFLLRSRTSNAGVLDIICRGKIFIPFDDMLTSCKLASEDRKPVIDRETKNFNYRSKYKHDMHA